KDVLLLSQFNNIKIEKSVSFIITVYILGTLLLERVNNIVNRIINSLDRESKCVLDFPHLLCNPRMSHQIAYFDSSLYIRVQYSVQQVHKLLIGFEGGFE